MRRVLVIAMTAALFLGVMVGAAGADVDRQQMEESVFNYNVSGYEHTYTVLSECGVDLATGYWNPNPTLYTETFEFFHLSDTSVHFKASYDWTSYWHEFTGTSTDGGATYQGYLTNDTQNLAATLTLLTKTEATDYKNHGAYVKASNNKKEAAQSCLGMPETSG